MGDKMENVENMEKFLIVFMVLVILSAQGCISIFPCINGSGNESRKQEPLMRFKALK